MLELLEVSSLVTFDLTVFYDYLGATIAFFLGPILWLWSLIRPIFPVKKEVVTRTILHPLEFSHLNSIAFTDENPRVGRPAF